MLSRQFEFTQPNDVIGITLQFDPGDTSFLVPVGWLVTRGPAFTTYTSTENQTRP